jgi:transposase InsO family protein
VIGSGPRKRYLYVAIDRASRLVHLRQERGNPSLCRRLPEGSSRRLPLQGHHVLTDRGSCFTAEGFEAACRKLGVQHRKTKPYTPQTNGMVERFNGRIGREVLVMCIGTHDALERLLRGYNLAYNARRQRVLNSQSPDQVVQTRLQAKPQLVDPAYQPPSPCDRTKIKVAAQLIVHNAKDVSHPDTLRMIKAYNFAQSADGG